MNFDHIGVFVASIDEGRASLSALLPIVRHSPIYDDPLLLVRVQFLYDSSDVCYELVAPFGPGNPVDGVLKSRKNILNHVAYRSASFDADLAGLNGQGCFQLAPAKPALAFGGCRVAFLVTPLNFIIELVEEAAA